MYLALTNSTYTQWTHLVMPPNRNLRRVDLLFHNPEITHEIQFWWHSLLWKKADVYLPLHLYSAISNSDDWTWFRHYPSSQRSSLIMITVEDLFQVPTHKMLRKNQRISVMTIIKNDGYFFVRVILWLWWIAWWQNIQIDFHCLFFFTVLVVLLLRNCYCIVLGVWNMNNARKSTLEWN